MENSREGNTSLATISLVMGILSLLSLCCFPPAIFVFSGLGILFSCLSKGQHSRPGTAKAGMAIGVSCIAVLSALIIGITAFFITSDRGRSFLQDYISLLTSENLTQEDLYDFLDKYLYDYNMNLPDSMSPYNNNSNSYNDDESDSHDGFDSYNDSDSYNGSDFFEDDFPNFYPVPDSDNNGNFI